MRPQVGDPTEARRSMVVSYPDFPQNPSWNTPQSTSHACLRALPGTGALRSPRLYQSPSDAAGRRCAGGEEVGFKGKGAPLGGGNRYEVGRCLGIRVAHGGSLENWERAGGPQSPPLVI